MAEADKLARNEIRWKSQRAAMLSKIQKNDRAFYPQGTFLITTNDARFAC